MRRRGVVVLPTIIIFGAVALGIVIAGLFAVQLINRSTFGIRLTAETQAAIESVLFDAHLRLVRGDLTGLALCSGGEVSGLASEETFNIGRILVTAKFCREECGIRVCRYRTEIEGRAPLFIVKKTKAVFDEDIVSGQVNLTSVTSVEF